MTDVLILHRIPGGRPGQILPLDDRLQNHVDAGNAKILPNENAAFGYKPKDTPASPVMAMTGSGHAPDDDQLELGDDSEASHDEDFDDDTED